MWKVKGNQVNLLEHKTETKNQPCGTVRMTKYATLWNSKEDQISNLVEH